VTHANFPPESVTTVDMTVFMSGAAPTFEEREDRRLVEASPWQAFPRRAATHGVIDATNRGLVDLFRGTGLHAYGVDQPTDRDHERPAPLTAGSNPVAVLRTSTGLPMADIARLLRLSRRAAYDRLRGVRGTPANQAHETWVIDVIGSLSSKLDPPRLRRWLVAGQPPAIDLVAAGETSRVEKRAEEELSGELPRLRRLEATEKGPAVAPMSTAQIAAELQRFATPAAGREIRRREPRELLFGDTDE
jgi:hypothetical protein